MEEGCVRQRSVQPSVRMRMRVGAVRARRKKYYAIFTHDNVIHDEINYNVVLTPLHMHAND